MGEPLEMVFAVVKAAKFMVFEVETGQGPLVKPPQV